MPKLLEASSSVNIALLSNDQRKDVVQKERHKRKIHRLKQVREQCNVQSRVKLDKVRHLEKLHTQKLCTLQKRKTDCNVIKLQHKMHGHAHEGQLTKENCEKDCESLSDATRKERLKILEDKAKLRHKLALIRERDMQSAQKRRISQFKINRATANSLAQQWTKANLDLE